MCNQKVCSFWQRMTAHVFSLMSSHNASDTHRGLSDVILSVPLAVKLVEKFWAGPWQSAK